MRVTNEKFNRPLIPLIKACSLFTLLIVTFCSVLNANSQLSIFILCFIYAHLLLLYGLNVLHEACHTNLSNYPLINKFFAYNFDIFVGVSSHQYIHRHALHHKSPNTIDNDDDIETGGIFRFSPFQRRRWYHRYQHLYALPLYSLMTLVWGPIDDSKRLIAQKIGQNKYSPSFKDTLIQLGLKLVHYSFFLLIPLYIFGTPAALIFLFLHMYLGITIGLVFQVAHITSECQFYQNSHDQGPWRSSQLTTSANFAIHNQLWNFLLGGLNHQASHHLHPYKSYQELPKISLQLLSDDTVITYPSFTYAICRHFRHLYFMGRN